MYGKRVYTMWARMIQNCTNENATSYRKYGGAGVKVCERWRDFENFFYDMGEPPSPAHTLERCSVLDDFAPEYCEWVVKQKREAE